MVERRLASVGLAEALAEIALRVEAETGLDRTLAVIVERAADTIPGVEFASVSLREQNRVRTAARTAAFAEQVDQLQYATAQGPCLDAIESAHTFRTGNIATDSRWPAFAAAAAEIGVVSMMAFHLRRPGGPVLGALNLHSTGADAYDDDAQHVGVLFAAHVTVALVGELDRESLHAGLLTRDAIGTAKGILMHQHHLTEDQAFGMLVRASQRANVKLRDVAQWIITDTNNQARRTR